MCRSRRGRRSTPSGPPSKQRSSRLGVHAIQTKVFEAWSARHPNNGLRGLECTPSKQRSSRLGVHAIQTKVFEAWSARHPNKGTGATCCSTTTSAHPAAATLDYLEATRVQLVTQTAYSPGSGPCEFFLFPRVKQQLKGKQFQGVEGARAFFEGVISDKPFEPFSRA